MCKSVCVCVKRIECISLRLTVSISCGFYRWKQKKRRKDGWKCSGNFSRCRCCLLLLQKCDVIKCCKQPPDPIHAAAQHVQLSAPQCWILLTWRLNHHVALCFSVFYYYYYYILHFDFVFSILHLQWKWEKKVHMHVQKTERMRGIVNEKESKRDRETRRERGCRRRGWVNIKPLVDVSKYVCIWH